MSVGVGVGAKESFGKDEQLGSMKDVSLQSGAAKKDEAGEGIAVVVAVDAVVDVAGFLLVGRSFAPSR